MRQHATNVQPKFDDVSELEVKGAMNSMDYVEMSLNWPIGLVINFFAFAGWWYISYSITNSNFS